MVVVVLKAAGTKIEGLAIFSYRLRTLFSFIFRAELTNSIVKHFFFKNIGPLFSYLLDSYQLFSTHF